MEATQTQGEVNPQIRKAMELLAGRAADVKSLLASVEQDFEKSPEGKEAEYLIKIMNEEFEEGKNFIMWFKEMGDGKRGIDTIIDFLKEPKGVIAKDEKLAERMDKIKKDLVSKIPHVNEIISMQLLRRKILALKPAPLNAFKLEFVSVINEIKRELPDSELTKEIRQYEQNSTSAKMTKMMGLFGLEYIAKVCRVVYSRLALGSEIDFEGRKEFERQLVALPGIGSWEKLGLPNEKNDAATFANWVAFTEKLRKEKENAAIIQLFKKLDRYDDAKNLFLDLALKKKVDDFARDLYSYLRNIQSDAEVRKVEIEAIKEFLGKVDERLKVIAGDVKDHQKELVKTLKERAESLKHDHEKKLAKFKEIAMQIQTPADKVALVSELAAQDLAEIQQLGHTRDEFLIRALDTTRLMRARNSLQNRMMNRLDDTRLNAEFDEIIGSGASPWAINVITKMKSLFNALSGNEIEHDQFSQEMAKIDQMIGQLKDQLHTISTQLRVTVEREARLAEEYERLRDRGEEELDRGYGYAGRSRRELDRLGYSEERYEHLN